MSQTAAPFFSIVIPTRNRAHLLKSALESAVWQDFDDYEVIVSDNQSSDQTKAVVASAANRQIRYVQPASYLYVHDHWDFAIRHACGRYVLILADDDVLLPHALSTFAELIRSTGSLIVGCKYAEYFTLDYPLAKQRNTIRFEGFTGELTRLSTHSVLTECFRFNPVYYPRATVPISKTIIDGILQKLGHFFERPFPEFVAYVMAYSMIDHFFLLDKPLAVLGRTADSLGPRAFWLNQDPNLSESGENLFAHVPLRGVYSTNGIAESFLRAKRNLPERFELIDLSYADYYAAYYSDMIEQQKLGRDIQRDMDEYQRVTESLPEELRNRVKSSVRDSDKQQELWYRLLWKAKNAPRRILSAVKDRVIPSEKGDFTKKGVIRGEQVGVKDIVTCAEWTATIANGGNQDVPEVKNECNE